jgi:cytochrome P450
VERLRRIEDLPGPRGLPLIGNALQIDTTRLHLIAEGWAREHGEYFRFRIGARQILVLANPETIAAALRERPEGFQRTSRLMAISKEMGFNGLFSATGDAWRRQRPMVMSSFDPGHIKRYYPTLLKVTERFARRWQRAAMPIDLQADLMRYTVDVTAGLAFGVDMNTLESDEEVIQTHLDKIFPSLFKRLMSPFPLWRVLADIPLYKHLKALNRAVDEFISQTRARLEANPDLRERPTNLIEAMIAARDAPGSELTDSDVAGNILTMLLAGEDTTANTLAWLIYLLDRHPDAHARARDEARAARIDHYEDVSAMPFIEACINETMRLKPVAPIIMLEPIRDTVIAGIEMPAGTIIMCLMRVGATDERHYPDPWRFDPSRSLSQSAKRASMPFGAGARLCPGRYLALLEMKMVMAMLFNYFDIERVSTPDGGEAREHLAFTMAPVGLKLALRPR